MGPWGPWGPGTPPPLQLLPLHALPGGTEPPLQLLPLHALPGLGVVSAVRAKPAANGADPWIARELLVAPAVADAPASPATSAAAPNIEIQTKRILVMSSP